MDEETLMHCYFFIFDNLLLLSNDSVSQVQLFSADPDLTDWSFIFRFYLTNFTIQLIFSYH